MSLENKVDRIEEAILIMKELVLRHEERLDEHNQKMSDFNIALENERKEREESRKDFDFKLNALIDAQIKNEIDIGNLKEASKSQLNRIETLENK